jgi:murein DD-endopeptidase MepM/ murein hydrolase activator NlpD
MKLNCNSFFDGEFEYLNLNELYLKYRNLLTDTKIPSQIQFLLNQFHNNTFGGYAEDRKDIWKGTYLDKHGNYIHLGVDINVRAGTNIRCPFDAKVIDIFIDSDTQIGWGGRIILQPSEYLPYLVLAHIEPTSLVNKNYFKKGEIIGQVGTWPANGNTFQHLHVQLVKDLDINNFDGYGCVEDLSNNIDPFEMEFKI